MTRSRNDPATVLVVDDEPMIRSLIIEFLTLRNLRSIEAANGAEALRKIRWRGEYPALVVTDLLMPGMSGLELLRELRRDVPQLRALFVSGYFENHPAVVRMLDGKTRFLAKPFNFRTFEAHLRTLIPGLLTAQTQAKAETGT